MESGQLLTEKGNKMRKRKEIMDEINGSIDQICESCHNVDDGDILEACYVANCVEQWLDQLRREIEEYENAEEDEDDNSNDK